MRTGIKMMPDEFDFKSTLTSHIYHAIKEESRIKVTWKTGINEHTAYFTKCDFYMRLIRKEFEIIRNMEDVPLDKIAEVIYDMSIDMDYEDYAEQKETEISSLVTDLQKVVAHGCNTLLTALEIIATQKEEKGEEK